MDETNTKPRTFVQSGYGIDFPGPMSDATKARNAKTSAAQVRRFLSGRVSRDFGYLTRTEVRPAVPDSPDRTLHSPAVRYSVTTFDGAPLLAFVSVTKTTAPAFGWNGRATRYYFSGKDARGRVWHGSSPGPGMFARLILNKRRAPRKKPASRAALLRMLRDLYGVATGSARFLKDAQRIGDRNPYCNPAVRTVGKFLGDLS